MPSADPIPTSGITWLFDESACVVLDGGEVCSSFQYNTYVIRAEYNERAVVAILPRNARNKGVKTNTTFVNAVKQALWDKMDIISPGEQGTLDLRPMNVQTGVLPPGWMG